MGEAAILRCWEEGLWRGAIGDKWLNSYFGWAADFFPAKSLITDRWCAFFPNSFSKRGSYFKCRGEGSQNLWIRFGGACRARCRLRCRLMCIWVRACKFLIRSGSVGQGRNIADIFPCYFGSVLGIIFVVFSQILEDFSMVFVILFLKWLKQSDMFFLSVDIADGSQMVQTKDLLEEAGDWWLIESMMKLGGLGLQKYVT